MGRLTYCDDWDEWALIRQRGAIARATRGQRGQAFLRALLEALDAMPEKVLISEELQNGEGDVCAIGALGKHRRMDMSRIDPEDQEQVALAFNIAVCLAFEVASQNDDGGRYDESPQHRWTRMRAWVARQIKQPETADAE